MLSNQVPNLLYSLVNGTLVPVATIDVTTGGALIITPISGGGTPGEVLSFNGRVGNVVLSTADVNAVGPLTLNVTGNLTGNATTATTAATASAVALANITGAGTGVPAALALALDAPGGLASNGATTFAPVNAYGLVPEASGNSNAAQLRNTYAFLGQIAANQVSGATVAGTYFTWISTGDSIATFVPNQCLQAIQNIIPSAGSVLGTLGASALVTQGSFTTWPSGLTYTVNSTHTPSTSPQAYCDTFKVYFPSTTAGAAVNTFQIQSNLNGGGWVTETNITMAQGVTGTGTGAITTGLTTVDMNNAGVVGCVATVKKGSPGLYAFRVVNVAGTNLFVAESQYNSAVFGSLQGNISQGGIDVTDMNQTHSAILNPILFDVNPTVVSLSVRDTVAQLTSGLANWQTLIHGACPNADFIVLGPPSSLLSDYNTNESASGDNPLGQENLLINSANTWHDAYFDCYGIVPTFKATASRGIQSQIAAALTSGGTTLTLPSGTLATQCALFNTGLLLCIWDQGTSAGVDPTVNTNHFEYVQVTAGSGTSYTITRGVGGTTAVAHGQYSNIASGWSVDGIHPNLGTPCPWDVLMSMPLLERLGFGAYSFSALNYIGLTPFSSSNTNMSGINMKLGTGTSTPSLILQAQILNARPTISAIDLNGLSGTHGYSLQFDPANDSVALEGSNGQFIKIAGTAGPTINGGLTLSGGNFAFGTTPGPTLFFKTGTNGSSGTVTLTAGAGTITSTALDSTRIIIFQLLTASGANAYPQSVVGSGSATVTGLATDNSTYRWIALGTY